MVDFTFLKNTVEAFVVDWVCERIGVKLTKRRVFVGKASDGTPVHFEFDSVSSDGHVGLLFSACQTVKPGGTRKLHVDASILLNAPFQRRLMAFISEDVRLNFVNKCDGLLPLSGIEMFVCTLPPTLASGVARFQAAAKMEVGDLGRDWKPGGRRR